FCDSFLREALHHTVGANTSSAAVCLLGKGHTDACGQQYVTVGDLERFGGDRPPQPFGQVHHLLGARTAFHQDREFVPAPARQGRGGVQFTAESAGRLTQQVVTTYVPRRVVDGGETVQIGRAHV